MYDDEREPAQVLVHFGPKEHQVVTAEVAAMMLTLFREKQPELFGMYLAEVLTGVRPSGGRGPKRQ